MPDKRVPLVEGEYYHIFNRGVAHMPTFKSTSDYRQAILSLSYYLVVDQPIKFSRFKEFSVEQKSELLSKNAFKDHLVDVISYCLMPNHIHLLLKQTAQHGISLFMSRFTNSYTRYFNTKYERVGPIFQGVFKAVHVDTTEQLLHLSRYIHLNPVVSHIVSDKNFVAYPWSSLADYMRVASKLVKPNPVLEHFSTRESYMQFVMDRIEYGKALEEIKHLVIE